MAKKRHHLRFTATEKVSEPAKISFTKKDGTKLSFEGHKDVKEKVDVDFMARNKKK